MALNHSNNKIYKLLTKHGELKNIASSEPVAMFKNSDKSNDDGCYNSQHTRIIMMPGLFRHELKFQPVNTGKQDQPAPRTRMDGVS